VLEHAGLPLALHADAGRHPVATVIGRGRRGMKPDRGATPRCAGAQDHPWRAACARDIQLRKMVEIPPASNESPTASPRTRCPLTGQCEAMTTALESMSSPATSFPIQCERGRPKLAPTMLASPFNASAAAMISALARRTKAGFQR